MDKILELKREIKMMSKILQNYSAYNNQLNFLVNFVARELLNSKSMINLEDLYLNLKIDERMSFSSSMSLLNNNFYSTFFNKTSCVVVLELEANAQGSIRRVS